MFDIDDHLTMMSRLLVLLLLFHPSVSQNSDVFPQHCQAWTLSEGSDCSWEPDLRPMIVDFGSYNETFYAYVTPDVSLFYNQTKNNLKAARPSFQGQYGKFVNMSPEPIKVFWDPGKGGQKTYISDISPFESSGTATYVTHKFVVTSKDEKPLTSWTISKDTQVYYYDPYDFDIQKASKQLNAYQLPLYQLQLVNKIFADQYKQFTGREWLALYKQKMPPRYHMWRPDSIGQTYVIETQNIHFEELPDNGELSRGTSVYGPRPDEKSRMRRYLTQQPILNLTLTALSVSPRVFEVKGFLSDVEIEHILQVASKSQLKRSSTRSSEGSNANSEDSTRTSTNSWIARNTDMVLDQIYQRAADTLQINEALLRWRRQTEVPELVESKISISERLQLVHYDVGQKYDPHFDFVMPPLVHLQPSRFVTVLFYLNDEGLLGGETSFPLWLNAETSEALKVKPEKGKAVIFYNLLPDGNYDDRSVHGALPVVKGEKWLTNLWVWDPVLDHTATEHI